MSSTERRESAYPEYNTEQGETYEQTIGDNFRLVLSSGEEEFRDVLEFYRNGDCYQTLWGNRNLIRAKYTTADVETMERELERAQDEDADDGALCH